MKFRPTTLPFQLQENLSCGYEPDCWTDMEGLRYVSLDEANEALTRLESASDRPLDLRVYCDPTDVAKVILEAGIMCRMNREVGRSERGKP